MRSILRLAGMAVVAWASMASVAAAGQADLCRDCLLGVYDDQGMTRNRGSIQIFQVKSVYLGVHLAAGVQIDDLRFTASYPPGFTVIDVTPLVSGATYDVGDNTAHVTWPQCVSGTRALFRVRVLTTTTVRNGLVQLSQTEASACGNGATASWILPAGCYVLNASSSAPPCATEVAPVTWSVVKELFRSIDSL
jgi:hypothetical protein